MNYLEKNQIFFDRSQKRKGYVYFIIFFSFIFVISCLSITIFSFRTEPVSLANSSSGNFSLSAAENSSSPITIDSPLELLDSSIFRTNIFSSLNLPQNFTGNTSSSAGKNFAYFVNWDEASRISLENNIEHIDGLFPEWLHLGENGNLIFDDPDVQASTLQFIKSRRPDLPIYALINNYNPQKQLWDSQLLSLMMRNTDLRNSNIEKLYQYVKDNNLAGISIDYENINPTDQPLFAAYLESLYAKFHPEGFDVSINIPLEDNDYNPSILSKNCDRIILMAYDEFTSDSPVSGPVAANDWYQNALQARFQSVPSDKYIVALGNYGYDWASDGTSQTIDFQQALESAKDSNANINLGITSLNPNFTYASAEINHEVWYLDSTTFFNQTNIAYNLGHPAGVALWRLGSEDPSIWNFFGTNLALNQNTAETLKNFISTYAVAYDGQGEILKLTDTQKTGLREINFDQNTKTIIGEKILSFPSAYRIERTGATDPKKISLTFDDGPDAAYTPQILDILKKYNIKGSFFVIGLNAEANPDVLKKIYEGGNDIGIHTFTHPEVSSISVAQYKIEIAATDRLLESTLGIDTKLFRPPYVENSEPQYPSDTRTILESSRMGYSTVSLGVDPEDWKNPDAQEIAASTISAVEKNQGNIILLHDGGGNREETVKALPKIISALQNEGYQFVSVSDLMNAPRDQVMPPLAGSDAKIAKVNLISFSLFSSVIKLIKILFYLGVILASIRIIFIAVLAEVQIKRKKAWEKAWKKKRQPDNFKVSVVIPAYNEERVIAKTISSLFHSVRKNFDIIVVNDGSKDNTAQVVEKEFRGNPRVKLYNVENRGKAEALNFGISKTDADIIITLDADTIFRWDTIKNLLRRFHDPRVGAVAGNVVVGNQKNLLTRWQAIEYITSQNFDRRAFELVNAITVVPGSVGAWRRKAILEAGGFSTATLAEDADMTFAIIRNGYKVAYEEKAVAYTESPDTIRSFLRQRFRWMYGTLQAACKNIDLLFEKKFNGLSLVAIPNVIIFQVLFSLISPFMDLTLVLSIIWALWQKNSHPNDFSAIFSARQIIFFYAYFTLIDILIAFAAFISEENKKWSLIWLLPLQRFFYRQLLYIVSLKSLLTALSGKLVLWGKQERKNTVEKKLARQIASS